MREYAFEDNAGNECRERCDRKDERVVEESEGNKKCRSREEIEHSDAVERRHVLFHLELPQ
jgi:hypothetical protein